jgi:hypothetical protein
MYSSTSAHGIVPQRTWPTPSGLLQVYGLKIVVLLDWKMQQPIAEPFMKSGVQVHTLKMAKYSLDITR